MDKCSRKMRSKWTSCRTTTLPSEPESEFAEGLSTSNPSTSSPSTSSPSISSLIASSPPTSTIGQFTSSPSIPTSVDEESPSHAFSKFLEGWLKFYNNPKSSSHPPNDFHVSVNIFEEYTTGNSELAKFVQDDLDYEYDQKRSYLRIRMESWYHGKVKRWGPKFCDEQLKELQNPFKSDYSSVIADFISDLELEIAGIQRIGDGATRFPDALFRHVSKKDSSILFETCCSESKNHVFNKVDKDYATISPQPLVLIIKIPYPEVRSKPSKAWLRKWNKGITGEGSYADAGHWTILCRSSSSIDIPVCQFGPAERSKDWTQKDRDVCVRLGVSEWAQFITQQILDQGLGFKDGKVLGLKDGEIPTRTSKLSAEEDSLDAEEEFSDDDPDWSFEKEAEYLAARKSSTAASPSTASSEPQRREDLVEEPVTEERLRRYWAFINDSKNFDIELDTEQKGLMLRMLEKKRRDARAGVRNEVRRMQ
ncbi:hypothetical protein MMC13_001345 [Lambiella insularis]|nr:hypothetical protein [Lambiella insularis]